MRHLAFCGMFAAAFLVGCGPSAGRLSDKGISEFQVGRLDQAEQSLQQALDLNPSLPEALYYMGRVSHARGYYEKAVYYYQQCLDSDPRYTQANRWLAKAQEPLGRTGQTLRFLP